MTSRRLWILSTLVFLLCQPPGGLPAGKPPLSPRLEKSLLDDIPTSRATAPETVVSEPPSSRTPPLPTVPAGEDLGRQGESDPLLPIELQMRQLHRRLVDGDTGRETQLLQIRLVEDLEGLAQGVEGLAVGRIDERGLLEFDGCISVVMSFQ